MAYLEKEMAEFVVSHSRISALLLATAVLLAIPTAVYGQRTLPPPPPAVDGNQQILLAVQKQLDAMQKRIEQLEAELPNRETGQPSR